MKASAKASLVFILMILSFSALASLAAGQDQAAAPAGNPGQPRFRLGPYFEGWTINDKNLRSFFHHSQRNLGGFEASVHVLYNIDVWTSRRLFSDETTTTYLGNIDKFQISANSLGLIYRPIIWRMLEPFIGAGLEIYSYSETILGKTDIPYTSGNAVGFHAQAGTYINVTKFLAGKLFVRVNVVKDTLADALPDGATKLDLGGKEFGVGLVVRF